MTLEIKTAPAPPDTEAWPFLEKLNAGAIMVVCASATELQRDENSSLPTSIALALINARLKNFFNNPLLNRLPDSSSRRLATSGYHDLLFSIPLTELTIIHGLPKHSKGKSNYIDRNADLDHKVDPPLTEKVQRFLRFQRYAALLKQDPTAMAMLENGVMSEFLESTKKAQNGQPLRILLEFGPVSSVSDLLKPEVKSTLTPSTLACLQAYVDYRKIYVAASAPQMI